MGRTGVTLTVRVASPGVPMPQPWTLLRGASFARKAKHLSPCRSKLRHYQVSWSEGASHRRRREGEMLLLLTACLDGDAVA